MGTGGTNCPQFALDGGVSWTTGLSGQKQGNCGANQSKPEQLVPLGSVGRTVPAAALGSLGHGWAVQEGVSSPLSLSVCSEPLCMRSHWVCGTRRETPIPPPAPACLPPTAGPQSTEHSINAVGGLAGAQGLPNTGANDSEARSGFASLYEFSSDPCSSPQAVSPSPTVPL